MVLLFKYQIESVLRSILIFEIFKVILDDFKENFSHTNIWIYIILLVKNNFIIYEDLELYLIYKITFAVHN